MRNILKNKKGFTLVELVIALLIFVAMTGAVAAAVGPTLRGVNRVIEISEVGNMSDTIVNTVSADLQNAIEVISPTGAELTFITQGHKISFSTSGGRLMRAVNDAEARPVFDDGYYGGRDVSLTFTPGIGGVTIAVTLSSGGETVGQNDYFVSTPLIS